MKPRNILNKFFAGISFLMLVASFIPASTTNSIEVSAQTAPFEPTCQNLTSTPTFNPYPITTSNPNPTYGTDDCQDIPLLSFFAIDTANGNPREINAGQNQNITYEIYYNNGATPGSPAIQNPTVKVMVNQINSTRYCISATLSGSNAVTVTSAEKGGDLCINVPENTNLNIVGNTTVHFPDADERRYESETTGRNPSDVIPDNSQGSNVSNPIYMAFPGTQLTTTSGFQFKSELEAGFLGYGYILSQIVTTPAPVEDPNLPPTVPGQEITIIRGESGSFQTIVGSDPDNNTPLSYSPNDLPAFCTYNEQTTIIDCQSNESTPVRSTFTVTPTDSLGLVGTPGTFIVNIIEPNDPNLSTSQKSCVVLDSTTPCNSSDLTIGDQVIYTIRVENTGGGVAENVVVTDTYDNVRLNNITNLSPEGTIDQNTGTIVIELGDMNPGDVRDITFDATITDQILNTDIILNEAVITADNLPDQNVSTQFPVVVPNSPNLSTSNKICKAFGTSTNCNLAGLTAGSKVSYTVNVTNTGEQDAFNVKVLDTYDLSRLTDITAIEPNGVLNENEGTITWELGTVQVGQTVSVSFDAVVRDTIKNGDIILNKALITATDLPDQEVMVDFPVGIVLTETPRSGGATIFFLLLIAALGGGGYYYYKKHNNHQGEVLSFKR